MNFNDLKKLYKELIKEDVDISSENIKELTSFLYRSKFILEQEYINGWKLVNEVVEDPELTPIPKNIFINIAKNLCKEYAIVKYSYKDLYQNLKEYDYEYYNEFKENLKKYSATNASLYVILCPLDLKHPANSNKTIQVMKSSMSDADTYRLFQEILKNINASAITLSEINLSSAINKNSFIFLNRDKLRNKWKDTLEHELTHFIQRIVGFDKSLSKTFNNEFLYDELNNPILSQKLIEFVENISNCPYLYSGLTRFLLYIFKNTEQHTFIKNIINFIQREYEYDKDVYEVNHKKLKISQIESLNNWKMMFREKWIKNYLEWLNSDKCKEWLKEEYIKYSKSNESHKFKKFLLCIAYYGIKLQLGDNYNIDEMILNHFKKFKFRDI